MKRYYYLLIISACCFLGIHPVSAEESEVREKDATRLSLKECISRALINSRTLVAERHRLAALDAQVEQAFWSLFSRFSVETFGSFVPDKCVDQERYRETGGVFKCGTGGDTSPEHDYKNEDWGPTLRIEVKGGVPIYTFGKISSGKKATHEARAAKQAEYPMFEHQVRYQVQQAFHAVSGAREMLYTIEKGRGHLKKARDKVEKDLESQEGTSTEIDLIKLKVFQNEIDRFEVQAREIERVGLAALRFLVGGSTRDKIDIVDKPQERDSEELAPLEEYKDTALEHRPELGALKHAVKAIKAKVALRRAEFWPDLLVVGGFRYGWTPGRDELNNWALKDNYNFGPSWALGLSIKYKLDFGLDIYRLKEAKAELAALTTDQRAAHEGVMLEVEKVYHQVSAAGDSLSSMNKSRRLIKGWIAAALQNQAAGLASAKEVKDALSEYFKVMAAIHQLTHDYNVGMAELARVTGNPEGSK